MMMICFCRYNFTVEVVAFGRHIFKIGFYELAFYVLFSKALSLLLPTKDNWLISCFHGLII